MESKTREFFEPRRGGDNQTRVKTFLDKLKEDSITYQNFVRYSNEIDSIFTVIEAQVENQITEYSEAERRHSEMKTSQIAKSAMENRYVPLEMYDDASIMHNRVREIASWCGYEVEIFLIMKDKLIRLLNDAKAMQVMGDTLKEMKEFIKQQNELTKEIVTAKLQNTDDKMLTKFEKMLNNTLQLNKENNVFLMNSMNELAESMARALKTLVPRQFSEEIDSARVSSMQGNKLGSMKYEQKLKDVEKSHYLEEIQKEEDEDKRFMESVASVNVPEIPVPVDDIEIAEQRRNKKKKAEEMD